MMVISIFFFTDTATTEISTLSLHDALPISAADAEERPLPPRPPGRRRGRRLLAGDRRRRPAGPERGAVPGGARDRRQAGDRKSTRLNSSHANISYAVFCLKKKNTTLTSWQT